MCTTGGGAAGENTVWFHMFFGQGGRCERFAERDRPVSEHSGKNVRTEGRQSNNVSKKRAPFGEGGDGTEG